MANSSSQSDDSDIKKCDNCGATENLRKCLRCSDASYCSKICQRASWPKHKVSCDIMSGLKKIDMNVNQHEAMRQILKITRKSGQEVQSMTFTHAGPVNSTDTEMPRGVPAGFQLIKKATYEYVSHKNTGRQYGEGVYKKLYDDLVNNEGEWMEFFQHPLNQSHAGDTSMVLEQLKEIYSERKSFEELGGVLDMLEKTLHWCEKHCSSGRGSDEFQLFCDKTMFRMLATRYGMNQALGCFVDNVAIFRKICDEELRLILSEKRRMFNQLWKTVLVLINAQDHTNLKPESVHDLSDSIICRIMQIEKETQATLNETATTNPEILANLKLGAATNLGISVEEFQCEERDVQLKSCASCNKRESACGDFKMCQCKKVVYCGRPCQRAHFKKHRKVCASSKKA